MTFRLTRLEKKNLHLPVSLPKVRNYKRQIEEAEEIAALNLAKFRKAQQDLQEALERADLSEQAMAKFRARGRSQSIHRDI